MNLDITHTKDESFKKTFKTFQGRNRELENSKHESP